MTAADGKSYLVNFYNLDAIISVGYRVNSAQATQFRIWATQTLREFIVKGFVLDDERLKLNKRFGKDYFDELLERIREIRASERRFYLKVTDIYEQCSIDYDARAEATKTFFQSVQNKLHWAVTGKTAGLEERREHSEELLDRARSEGTQPHRLDVPRLRREPSGAASADEDGRLGGPLECVSEFQRISGPDRRGTCLGRSGQAPRGEQHAHFRVRQDQEFVSDFEAEVKRIQGEVERK